MAGEAPVVTVTLTTIDPATGEDTGTAVDPATYTDQQAAKGGSGPALSSAVLMVYGPRAKAVPVLATYSTTDPTYIADHTADSSVTPTQEHDLLLTDTTGTANPDTRVTADANGFHYQLQAIPAGMTDGTYMVQAQVSMYGGVSGTDYRTGSTGLITFNVNTDATPPTTVTDEAKVAGDACINCHGNTRMHIAGPYAHDVPFNTDYCLACHDQSGNHGDQISNRVHAVHSANTADGDLKGHTWGDVTYPQELTRCNTCHNSGNTSWYANPYAQPCIGCHGDAADATTHIEANVGQCEVCHGADAVFNVRN